MGNALVIASLLLVIKSLTRYDFARNIALFRAISRYFKLILSKGSSHNLMSNSLGTLCGKGVKGNQQENRQIEFPL